MKNINFNLLLITILGSTLLFSSCLKDDANSFNFNTVGASVSQLNSINYLNTNANAGELSANLNCYFMILRCDSTFKSADSIQFEVGGTLPSKNFTVTIGVDTASFSKFNSKNGGGYTLLPSNTYSITNYSITIPAGTRNISIPITFNTKLIDFSAENILPIVIKDAQGVSISGNFGVAMYEVVQGNQYMGLYQSIGKRVQGSYTAPINDAKYVYDLSGITTVLGSFPTASNAPSSFVPNAVVVNMADQAIYGAVGEQMDLTVNPTNNSVAVSNDNLYGFGVLTYSVIDPGTSTYDPANHVFNLQYKLVQGFTKDTSTVNETLTRTR